MANIRLKELVEANIDPKLTARSKETGKLVYFKTPQAKDKAMKAGTHEDPKAKKGGKPKADVKPNDMFGADYKKDRGGDTKIQAFKAADGSDIGPNKYTTAISKIRPSDSSMKIKSDDWMDDLDSIDTSDIKGKADPNADSFTHDGVFGATFKDPQTGKTITVGDAYEREDDSPAYQKAFAYVAKFDPDKEAVMGTQAYDDLQKKAAPKADVKSIIKGLLKKADKEFKGAYKLKDVVDGFQDNIDDSDDDGKELKARLDKGEDGTYVQTDETEGTVVFNDGSQYEFAHVEDGPIPVTKVGKEEPKTSSKLTSMLPKKTNYDDKSYWKDDEGSNTQGYTGDDDDSEDDNSWGDEAQFTSDRLSKIEDALKDDLNLTGNGFETTRESGGGMGGFEGPMTIVSKDADYNDENNYISLSVGSPNNDGKFSIVFANANGEPHFEPNYDALTGDNDLEPQQAYKVTKALMKMPEVQKVLKGEMKLDEFKPIYDKLKSKFSKTK